MIRVFDDLESLSQVAAGLFVDAARRAVVEHGRFSVALAGGSTPRRCYELLSRLPFCDQVPWGQVHVFWGDERCVPADDSRSNSRMARLALLDRVPLPAGQVHPMTCAVDPVAAALNYQQELEAFFPTGKACFDLIFLGLGGDGHTASLFPGTSALDETLRWVMAVHKPGEDFHRLTLTAPLINRAALVIFLVAGADKALILRKVLESSDRDQQLPARLISPEPGRLVWLVDRAAGCGPPNTEPRDQP